MSNNTSSSTRKKSSPSAPPRSARRRARELVLQGLYQWRVAGNDEAAVEAHSADLEGFSKADNTLFTELLRGIFARQIELEQELQTHLDRPFAELSPIEACILLIGSFELIWHMQTPYRVIINEAIELTKAYGGTDGHKYVNGVLDKLALKYREVEVNAANKKS